MLSRRLASLAVVALCHLVQACGADEPMLADQRTVTRGKGADAVPQGDGTPVAVEVPAPAPVESEVAVEDATTSTEAPAPVAEAPVVSSPSTPAPEPAPAPVDEPKEPDYSGPRYSKGTGGAAGFVEQEFTAANGLESSYKINVPADAGAKKPYGLHIHVHGDGGGGYADFPNEETRDGLIGVTVKAPNASLTWGRAAGRTHGEYLQDLIQSELVKKYNVDLERIYFSGVSGGAYFLTGNFIPSYGKGYRTGAFLMCGGEAPRVAFDEPEFLKDFSIYWQVTAGERNDILASVRRSMRAYKTALDGVAGDAKMQMSEIVGDGGHCEFDGEEYTSGIQYMMDLKFKVVLRE